MEHDHKDSRLLIVTGVAGSGRATAMRVLEDLGFYCVDNIPVRLAPSVVKLATEHGSKLKGIALAIDARERLFFRNWPKVFDRLAREGFPPQVIFLDASDEVLARRYSETRRPHPMAENGSNVVDSIHRERIALAEMRERADRVIDTTAMTVHELREVITAEAVGAEAGGRMTVGIVSFGYKYGTPVGLDLLFDSRFIPNPHFVPELHPLTGLDPTVRKFIMGQPEARRFLDEVTRLLEYLLPLYKREGKSYLTIGVGCTGGRHRSPMLAQEISNRLVAKGYAAEVRHHDISR
jgi:UPF0042 nucleotide-binding protein